MTFPQPPPQPYGQPPAPPQQPYGQQPPPQPPYAQPYGQPVHPGWQPPQPIEPTPEPIRGWVVPTVVIGALVTIGAVFAASATREGADSADAATQARDAVVRLTDAMYQGDCEGVQAASTGGYFRTMNLTCEDIAGNREWMDEVGMSFVIGTADVEGSSAEVPVEIVVTSDPSQGGTGYFTVVRTGDSWRVSNDQMN